MLAVGSVGRAIPWLVLAFAFLPVLDVALSVLNHLVTASLSPRCCRDWICTSTACRPGTVPWWSCPLFDSESDVRAALENLEVQFLANREDHLHFAVLSDFTDATTEVREDDAGILRRRCPACAR